MSWQFLPKKFIQIGFALHLTEQNFFRLEIAYVRALNQLLSLGLSSCCWFGVLMILLDLITLLNRSAQGGCGFNVDLKKSGEFARRFAAFYLLYNC